MNKKKNRIITPIRILMMAFLLSSNIANAQDFIFEEYITHPFQVEQIALKTNLLVDGAMVPNLGVEVVFQQQWSVALNYYMAWWHNNKKHRYWEAYAGSIEIKKGLGKRAINDALEGHHLGAYFMAGSYDFERGYKGLRSDFMYNVGLSYNYGVKIAKSLYLDFGIGLGYLGGKYKKYKPQDDYYCVYSRKRSHFFGPTKAEISLVWSIGDLFLKSKDEVVYEIKY